MVDWTLLRSEYVRISGILAIRRTERWIGFGIFVMYFLYRAIKYEYHAVLYFFSIYSIANIFSSLTPAGSKNIMDLNDLEFENGLPKVSEDLSKPFARKLPEFRLFQHLSISLAISLFCTFFELFKVKVFWPILVIYVFILIGIFSMKHLKHMKRFGYNPFPLMKSAGKGGNNVFL